MIIEHNGEVSPEKKKHIYEGVCTVKGW